MNPLNDVQARPSEKLMRLHRDIWVIALLTLIYAACLPFGTTTIDAGRDLVQAYQVASGSAFPVAGPQFKGIIHFGPLWFYLLGGLLFLTQSLTLTAFFIGLLAGSKFFLAYLSGSRLLDRRFGLLWATALAMPGWNTFAQTALTHTAMVEAAAMLVLYTLVRLAVDLRPGWLVAAGLAFSLALHAHPSTAALAPAGLAAYLYFAVQRRGLALPYLAAAILAFSLPFLPYLIAQAMSGWPELGSASAYVSQQTSLGLLGNLPAVWQSYFVTAPAVIGRYLMDLGTATQRAWVWLITGVWLLGAAGLLLAVSNKRLRGLVFLGLALFLAASVIVVGLRVLTSFYMVYVLAPLAGSLLALGIYALNDRLTHHAQWLSRTFMGVVILQFCLASAAVIATNQGGEASLPEGVLPDITHRNLDRPKNGLRFPAHLHDTSADWLCPADGHVFLHGDLAFIMDSTFAVGALLHCGHHDQIRLGGAAKIPQDQAWVGLSQGAWQALGLEPNAWLGSFGLAPPKRVIQPLAGLPLANPGAYPPRPYVRETGSEHRWRFETTDSEVVMVNNHFYWYGPPYTVQVWADGTPVEVLYQTPVSSLYRCTTCPAGGTVAWEVAVITARPEQVDIVTLDAGR